MNNNESQSQDNSIKEEANETKLNAEQTEQTNEQAFVVESTAEPVTKKSNIGWIITSAVLAVALIIVLIKPPFTGGNEAVATVNGVKITKDELNDKAVAFYGGTVLEAMISEELVAQQLKDNGITVTDEDLLAEISALKLQFGSEENFNRALTSAGMSVEDLKDNVRLSTMVRLALEPTISVSEEDILGFFNENIGLMGGSAEQVKASHILLETKEEAETILGELKAGADFATLAAEHGTDGTVATGGDLGYFTRGQMIQEFEDAVFALDVNELSDVVETTSGYHIILKTDHKPEVEPNFEAMKDAIRVELTNQQIFATNATYIDDLRASATIENKLIAE